MINPNAFGGNENEENAVVPNQQNEVQQESMDAPSEEDAPYLQEVVPETSAEDSGSND